MPRRRRHSQKKTKFLSDPGPHPDLHEQNSVMQSPLLGCKPLKAVSFLTVNWPDDLEIVAIPCLEEKARRTPQFFSSLSLIGRASNALQ